ncbi:unnamed protein product [Urochloa humidicola]
MQRALTGVAANPAAAHIGEQSAFFHRANLFDLPGRSDPIVHLIFCSSLPWVLQSYDLRRYIRTGSFVSPGNQGHLLDVAGYCLSGLPRNHACEIIDIFVRRFW